MPFAQIDAHTKFSYEDSGVPSLKDRPYTTLVLLHGFGFNSHIFDRLLPIAPTTHVRLVLLNRRGYSGSTPLSEKEITGITPWSPDNDVKSNKLTPGLDPDQSGAAAYMKFMEKRGIEIARFLAWFIDNEGIPPRSDGGGRPSGGISLLGWSVGAVSALSFLGSANTFDPDLTKKLETHLRKLILYDAPLHTLGYRIPDNSYNPLYDPELPSQQQQFLFAISNCSYWSHSPAALNLENPLRDPLNALEQRTPDSSSPATNFAPADLQSVGEHPTVGQGEVFVVDQSHPVNETMRKRAIFGNTNETSNSIVFPDVEITCTWGTRSFWDYVFTARSLMEEMASPPDGYQAVRPVKFLALEGCNHFIHWDDPLKALAAFAYALE